LGVSFKAGPSGRRLISGPSRRSVWGKGTAAVLLLAAFGTLPLLVATTFPGLTVLIVPIVVATGLLALAWARVLPRVPNALPALVGLAAAFSVVSILTGLLNGLSDEPYATPAYASLGLGMYTHAIAFGYTEYGRWFFEVSYDVYLPGLTFVQVPGVDYRWVSLGAWAGMIYLVRKDPLAVGGLATPWIPVLAANGQNDFVPLLAITIALVVRPRRGRWLWEVGSLALKQLANVVVFFYHVARREWLLAAASVVVTALILAPFFLIDPSSVVCHVLIGDPGTGCVGHPWTFFVFKRNYWLYPTWVGLVFYRPLASAGRRLWLRVRRAAPPTS